MKRKEGIKKKEVAEKLIEAIADGNFSKELRGRLRYWFLNIPEDGIEEEALVEWAERNIKADTSMPTKKERTKFQKLAELLGIDENKYHATATVRAFFNGRRFMLRAAAVLIPVLIAGGAFLLFNDEEATTERFVLYADHESGQEKFTLPDGSDVTLKNGSRLEYSDDFCYDRRVDLDGRALFDVTHDPAHPFSVHNEGLNVTVLGTVFHIRAIKNVPEAEIVLLSGSVKIEKGDYRQELTPGQILLLDKTTSTVLEYSQAKPGTIMRITGSDLSLDNTNAVDALSVVADYFEMKLVIEDDLVMDSYISCIMPHETSIEGAIAILNRFSDKAKFHVSGDTIYVSRE